MGNKRDKSRRPARGESTRRTCDLCAVFDQCGACQTLDVAYERQLADKQRHVESLFSEVLDEFGSQVVASSERAGIFHPILGMDEPFHYRDKVVSPYVPGRRVSNARGGQRGGKEGGRSDGARATGPARRGNACSTGSARREVLTGMYARGTHRLVPTDNCVLENRTAKAVTLAVRDLMMRWNIPAYDEDANTGFMRHAVVRVGHASGEVLVTLVTNDREFPSSRSFCRQLAKRVPAITTVVQNVNTRQTNVILGTEERVLYGPGFILDTLCGLSFRISSQSFYQVNSTQTEVLYKAAIRMAALDGAQTVIDAYCGTGTIGLVAAKCGAAQVIGVDNVESAVRDARQNALHNGIANARFVTADAGEFLRDAASVRRGEGVGSAPVFSFAESTSAPASATALASVSFDPDNLVLLMDPPRAGASEQFLHAVATLAPSRIVYISCNPATQARDVSFLLDGDVGYRIEAIQPVDMFPHTEHVECIVALAR